MTTASRPAPITFRLSQDIPFDIGWADAVRQATTGNSSVIRHLIQNPAEFPLGDDPATLLQQWWPSAGYMVYFVRRRTAPDRCEFVVSDGVFTLSIPSDANHTLSGLAAFVFDQAVSAWEREAPAGPCPLTPGKDGLPEAVVIHHLAKGEASISPYAPTLRALLKKEAL